MDTPKTSLSAGLAIRASLMGSELLKEKATKIFPIVVNEAKLPYIVYRRESMSQTSNKSGLGADTVQIEVACYAKEYAESIELAEAVRDALDCRQGEAAGLYVRSCTLYDAREDWTDDAMVQRLFFNIKL